MKLLGHRTTCSKTCCTGRTTFLCPLRKGLTQARVELRLDKDLLSTPHVANGLVQLPEKGSDTSGVLRSDDDFSSIGYSFEHSEPEHIAAAPRPTQPSSSRNDPGSPMVTFSADSPGIQTLAELKKEAVHDRQQKTGNEKGRYVVSSKETARAMRGVSISCKIMKEAYFKGMEWTRTFVSGPVDPRWNKYKFYCRFARQIYPSTGKGPEKFSDIIRQRNISARISFGDMNTFIKLIP